MFPSWLFSSYLDNEAFSGLRESWSVLLDWLAQPRKFLSAELWNHQ